MIISAIYAMDSEPVLLAVDSWEQAAELATRTRGEDLLSLAWMDHGELEALGPMLEEYEILRP